MVPKLPRSRLGPKAAFSNSGQFQKGKFYPQRTATQFKPGNYHGMTREEWTKTFEGRMTQKKLQKRVYAKVTKTHLEIQERIRAKADQLLDVLEDLALSETSSENARLAAIQQLMDRGYGKATQTNVNANLDSDAKPKDISTRELDKRIEETLERVERVTGGIQEETESPERSLDIRKYN